MAPKKPKEHGKRKTFFFSKRDHFYTDRWNISWYKCPNCSEPVLLERFKFCPDCGCPVLWNDK